MMIRSSLWQVAIVLAILMNPYDVFQVGSLSGFLMTFDSANAVTSYLPTFASPGPLDADLLDPYSSASGVFGGEVVALKLNIDFSDAGFLKGKANLHFGDLTLCGLDSVPALNGMTVRELGDIANTLLGGGPGPSLSRMPTPLSET